MRFATELVDLHADDVGGAGRRPDRGTDRVERSTARYLVGADGGRSTVRDRLGIGVEQLGAEGHHLSTLFRADLSAVMPEVPFVLTATVAPGVEGMFVATGRADSVVLRHGVASRRPGRPWPSGRSSGWPRGSGPPPGCPDLEPEVLGVFPYDFGAAVARGSGPGGCSWSVMPRTGPRRAARPG